MCSSSRRTSSRAPLLVMMVTAFSNFPSSGNTSSYEENSRNVSLNKNPEGSGTQHPFKFKLKHDIPGGSIKINED